MAARNLFNPITIFVVIAIAAAAYFFGFADPNAGKEERPQNPVPVRVQAAQISEFRDVIEALGTAQANESIVVTAQAQDIVMAVHFDDGDVVEAGDLLIELDSREEKARVQELKFRLAEANRQYQRLVDLRRQNAASQQQLETQDVQVKEIIAALEVAETQLAQKRIIAPFDGRLGIRHVSVGSLVSPGEQITTLDDVTPIKLDFNVPELFFASLRTGQSVAARSGAYPGEEFRGEILSIDSRVDPLTRSILVRATIPNDDNKLRPGMLLRVNLLRSVDETMILPEKAIVPINDRTYVYIIDAENIARQVPVTIGRRKPGIVEVLDGIEPGDKVVTEGMVRLRDGVTVTVREG
ncbi:efflux RND transporter periplasmic adaptor subunit [Pseudidiomarina sp.]|uniref:efflux RND transporter periplasmic adaptor subunit n=1 Tax=Pseudidiomarina sp. TaxID=2081707 RepID=UPI003A986C19